MNKNQSNAQTTGTGRSTQRLTFMDADWIQEMKLEKKQAKKDEISMAKQSNVNLLVWDTTPEYILVH